MTSHDEIVLQAWSSCSNIYAGLALLTLWSGALRDVFQIARVCLLANLSLSYPRVHLEATKHILSPDCLDCHVSEVYQISPN